MSLTIANTQRFLRSLGWQKNSGPNERVERFDSPKDADGDYLTLLLPSASGFKDTERRLEEAVLSLSGFLNLKPGLIKNKIINWDKDILKTRLFRDGLDINAIKLPAAVQIITELKGLLGAAAYSQETPKPFFPKLGGSASDFSEHCLFGHTFEGSFGIKVECPIPNVGQLTFLEGLTDPPFERLVIERIATGCANLAQAAQEGDVSLVVKNYEAGLNSNMLQALNSIYEKSDGLQIEYSVEWSPELAPTNPIIVNTCFVYNARVYDVAKRAASELEKEPEQERTVIVSFVTALKSDTPLGEGVQDSFDHWITLDWERERGVFVKIRAGLGEADYKAACDAHKLGKKIFIRGMPVKQGKYWFLQSPSDFGYAV